MLKSMYSGIGGLKTNQVKMDVIGNNIANVGTAGFKKKSVRFSDALYQTNQYATGPSNNFGGINASQIGLGSKVSGIVTIGTQGSLQLTGRKTDIGIDGDGYFVVAKGNGTVDDPFQKFYTRDGSMNLDAEGNLITAEGYRVLGKELDADGNEIGDLMTINIPTVYPEGDPDAKKVVEFNISVNGNGVVTITLEDGTREDISRVELAKFTNPEGLENVGGNRLIPTANSGDALYLTDGESTAFGWINQSVLEMSNVDLSEEFTEMIVTTRAFQAVSKVITTSDELLQEIIGLKR